MGSRCRVAGLVGLVVATAAGCSPPPDPLAECARTLSVIADDGTRLEVLEHRCAPAQGRRPALAAWLPRGADPAPWRAGLSDWGLEGRTLWLVVTPLRDGAEVTDASAVFDALASRPGVDPGRLGGLVTGVPAQALAHRLERLEPAPAALALVGRPDAPDSPAVPEGTRLKLLDDGADRSSRQRADQWLRRELSGP